MPEKMLVSHWLLFYFIVDIFTFYAFHFISNIAVYGSGPWSHLFQGSYEQSDIPIVMAYAAKIGPYADRIETTTSTDSANGVFLTSALLIISSVIFYFS